MSAHTPASFFERHPEARTLHPYCNTCGWRKGGLDSWNGRACKCGHSAPAFETVLRLPETRQ